MSALWHTGPPLCHTGDLPEQPQLPSGLGWDREVAGAHQGLSPYGTAPWSGNCRCLVQQVPECSFNKIIAFNKNKNKEECPVAKRLGLDPENTCSHE